MQHVCPQLVRVVLNTTDCSLNQGESHQMAGRWSAIWFHQVRFLHPLVPLLDLHVPPPNTLPPLDPGRGRDSVEGNWLLPPPDPLHHLSDVTWSTPLPPILLGEIHGVGMAETRGGTSKLPLRRGAIVPVWDLSVSQGLRQPGG